MVVGAKLGFGGEVLVCSRREPCPSLYRWRGRRPRGGSGVPPQLVLGGVPAWGGGLPPQLGFTSSSSFPLSKFSRLTFQFSYLTFQTRIRLILYLEQR